MATHDYVIDNSTGANVRADINSVLQAILTNNSSSSAPSTTAAYMFWADTTSGTLKIRNSSDNAWVELLQLDGTLTLEDGSASTPGLAFRDDLDTGIFSSGSNSLDIATGGSVRAAVNSTGVEVTGSVHCTADFRMGEKLKHLSDQDTFISFPSNDHIGFTTNNNTRMTIDDSGNVGIGTTTPAINLTVVGSNEEDLFHLSTGNAGGNTFAGVRGDNEAGIRIRGGGSERGGEIELAGGARNSDPAVIKFSTNTSNTFQERMRIDSSGNVAIGTTQPNTLLHVEGTNNAGALAVLRITNGGGSANTEVRLEFENGSHKVGIIAASHDTGDMGSLIFSTASSAGSPTERMRINKDGDVAIGISSPAAGLHLYKVAHYVPTDSGKATGGIHVRGQNGNAGEYGGAISFSCGDGNSSSAIAVSQEAADADVTGLGFFVHESSNGADDAVERLRINNKGLVQAKGRAGSYFGTVNTNESHVFNNTGNAIFLMQLHQEHHNGHCLRLRVGANNNNEAMDMVDYSASGAQRFKIANDGDVTNQNNSYGSLSDISLKENIVDAKSQWDDIKAIKVRNFNFKETPDKKLLGVVAQEIETVCSGLVTESNVKDPDDTTKITGTVKNVKYSVLYMKAIKCLQEAITKIEVLETKVAALEAA